MKDRFLLHLATTAAFTQQPWTTLRPRPLRAAAAYSETIDTARALLFRAAEARTEESDAVVEALLELEKAAKARAKDDPDSTAAMMQLRFTTGTVDIQKKTGRINYFPVKAVQSFDFATMKIENGIYLGSTAVIKFSGPFAFDDKSRKLTFDFDTLRLFDLIGIPIGKETLEKDKPFFIWIDANDDIATARGRGGGLALWQREA